MRQCALTILLFWWDCEDELQQVLEIVWKDYNLKIRKSDGTRVSTNCLLLKETISKNISKFDLIHWLIFIFMILEINNSIIL
jgi:hypothetical protein